MYLDNVEVTLRVNQDDARLQGNFKQGVGCVYKQFCLAIGQAQYQ